jgi:hypothetical protein
MLSGFGGCHVPPKDLPFDGNGPSAALGQANWTGTKERAIQQFLRVWSGAGLGGSTGPYFQYGIDGDPNQLGPGEFEAYVNRLQERFQSVLGSRFTVRMVGQPVAIDGNTMEVELMASVGHRQYPSTARFTFDDQNRIVESLHSGMDHDAVKRDIGADAWAQIVAP